jgi:hypothetical protein
MKKYLLGLTALVLAIGFTAFKTIKAKPGKKLTTYYYFQTNTNQGDNGNFLNSQVTFYGTGTSAPSFCDASNSHQCIVGFDATQVSGSGPYTINDNGGSDPQVPVSAAGFRYRSTK